MDSHSMHDHEEMINWNVVRQQIPNCTDADHPLQLIQACIKTESDSDLYEQIDLHLNQYIETVKKQFLELSR